MRSSARVERSGLVDIRTEKNVFTDFGRTQTRDGAQPGKLAEEAGAGAGELRRDEQEQLVDEIGLQERGREGGATLEQERLDAFGPERSEPFVQPPGAELELGSFRQRTPA